MSQLTFQWLPLKFRCSSFKFHWLLFYLPIKIKAFTLLSNTEIKLLQPVLLQVVYMKPEMKFRPTMKKDPLFAVIGMKPPIIKQSILLDLRRYTNFRYFLPEDFTRLRLELSHLREPKFKYNFQN